MCLSVNVLYYCKVYNYIQEISIHNNPSLAVYCLLDLFSGLNNSDNTCIYIYICINLLRYLIALASHARELNSGLGDYS